MDKGILHSRAERFVRSLEVLPDRWWFDGSNLTLLYGSEFHQVPFPESEQETYLAEDDEFPESVYVNPGDESRSPMEASETLQTEYILVVSICPDYWISDDLATAFQGTMGFIQDLITEEGIDASAISVQNDLENNEIDMIFQRTTDFEGMQQLHRDLTRAVENIEINAYVYAEFAGQLRNDFYPMTYGYPFGRQAMMARTWAAEDHGPYELIDDWKEGDDPLDLAGVHLGGAELRDAFLERANLEGADLHSADLQNADLRRTNLRNADLRAAKLREASFFEANLEGANLRSADLRDADFQYANLEGVNLVNADLDGADFRHSRGLTDEQKERINRVNARGKEWLILRNDAEDEPSVVCRICAAPLDGQTVTCGSKCRSRWVARIPGYAKSVKPRTLDAVFRTIAEADGDWITSSTINSVVADQFRDINISTGHVVNLARLYHNPEFVEMGSSGRGAMFRITGGTGLWDWLRPDLYALIKPDDVDTFESSVVIPPTKTIVERVQAMQEAFRVSEMQSKLIDLQTQAKLGMIRGPEDIMSIMMEAEDSDGRSIAVYVGPGNHLSVADVIDADHFVLIESLPRAEWIGERNQDHSIYADYFMDQLFGMIKALPYRLEGQVNDLNSEGATVVRMSTPEGRTIDYYYNTVYPSLPGDQIPELQQSLAAADKLIISGYFPEAQLLDDMPNLKEVYLYSNTSYPTVAKDSLSDVNEDPTVVTRFFDRDDLRFTVMEYDEDYESDDIRDQYQEKGSIGTADDYLSAISMINSSSPLQPWINIVEYFRPMEGDYINLDARGREVLQTMVDSLSDVEDMDPLEAMNDLFTHFRIDLYDENGDQVLIDEVVEVREAESATKTLYLGAESDGMAKCSNCDERGHRKTNCPHPERVKVVYPHILPDFEKWKSGESKMQLVGRIKRNILRIVGNESGIGAHQLVSRYHDNLGTASRTRSEVTRVTRIANAMPEILVWRDGYYLLGPGGKEEFFRTGPGSLKG